MQSEHTSDASDENSMEEHQSTRFESDECGAPAIIERHIEQDLQKTAPAAVLVIGIAFAFLGVFGMARLGANLTVIYVVSTCSVAAVFIGWYGYRMSRIRKLRALRADWSRSPALSLNERIGQALGVSRGLFARDMLDELARLLVSERCFGIAVRIAKPI